MSAFIYPSAEGNVVSLSTTLPSFTRQCDRQSGICLNPICTICTTILPSKNAKYLHAVYSYLNSPSFGGWNPKAKKKELFNPKSRFIIVHPTDPTTLSLLAFSMFRFEYEEDELVLYW